MTARHFNKKGYTLIELTVVIILIGIIMTLAAPRFKQSFFTDELKSTTRKFVGTIQAIRSEAISKNREYNLKLDFESNRFWVEDLYMTPEEIASARKKAISLPEGVRITDIQFLTSGKKMTGETEIHITKKGYITPALIHLNSDDNRRITINLYPFLGRIDVLEDYVAYEDIL